MKHAIRLNQDAFGHEAGAVLDEHGDHTFDVGEAIAGGLATRIKAPPRSRRRKKKAKPDVAPPTPETPEPTSDQDDG